MQNLELLFKVGTVLGCGIGAFYGIKIGVKVLEAKVAALETRLADNIAAIHKRVDDLVAQVTK